MNTQSSQGRWELGRVCLPIASYLYCSGVVVTITARSDDVRLASIPNGGSA